MGKYIYEHGGNGYLDNPHILDLSANINPFGLPRGVQEAIENEIKNISFYPDSWSKDLKREIGYFEGIEPKNIFCGNGASDIIFRLPIALKPKKALILAPTFADYERALKSFGTEVIYYPLKEENMFILDEGILEKINKDIDIIFICNPNNPTGVLTPKKLIERILEHCKETNTYVVIDECFIDFTKEAKDYSAKPLLLEYKNLVILKAFTKIFALPGIRLGYCICHEEIVDRLHYHGADWPVSNLSQRAGITALKNSKDYLDLSIRFIEDEREYMTNELKKIGFTVFNSKANYVFFKSHYDFLYKSLKERGVHIRWCNNYRNLNDSYFRVGISTKENNTRFINEIRGVIECQSQ